VSDTKTERWWDAPEAPLLACTAGGAALKLSEGDVLFGALLAGVIVLYFARRAIRSGGGT
jgi:hypothetical protein